MSFQEISSIHVEVNHRVDSLSRLMVHYAEMNDEFTQAELNGFKEVLDTYRKAIDEARAHIKQEATLIGMKIAYARILEEKDGAKEWKSQP